MPSLPALEVLDDLCLRSLTLPGPERRLLLRLHALARRHQGGPLAGHAAALLARVPEEAVILLATGAGAPPHLPHGETDGPPGVIILAQALRRLRRAKPVLLTEGRMVRPLEAAARAAGLEASVEALPEGPPSPGGAGALLDRHRPAALVAVEKLGENERGVIHDMRGEDVGASHASLASLVAAAKEAGVLTVAIGDRGNEVGFGLVAGSLPPAALRRRRCACPCGSTILSSVATEALVVAATSNWGAFAVAAALALLAGREDLLPDPAVEAAVREACVAAGARDGITRQAAPSVDGTPPEAQAAILTLLRVAVAMGRPARRRRPRPDR
ncbi:MAG TPA: glutamate cyclase domain-containing protein [Candidatus Methylomirabilis sp.]|nr:glutamate cyclase domain-containing protein [Candidatus Methylomirabilis sp.]